MSTDEVLMEVTDRMHMKQEVRTFFFKQQQKRHRNCSAVEV